MPNSLSLWQITHSLPGIEVAQSKEGIFISQCKYALDIHDDAGLLGSRPYSFPVEQTLKLKPTDGKLLQDPSRYRRLLVLEIVSGQKNSGFRHGENAEDLLSFAWRSWREGTASNLIDPTLKTGSRTEIMRCIHIGLLCVQENVADRPTMASVILMLNSYSLTLPVPSQPAFYLHSIGSDRSLGSEYNSGITRSDHSKSNSAKVLEYKISEITELHPR
ncbi:unnamed protein product [Prunus armeniaca]|uniref:S-locus receptor kinase C-terminal domain-containing protein n=1 Tax=Prunus armeniaca TaxID=36596 RepID=A0A6J5VCC5_PRUAR|nr:unnamed protein product [Prunus armeniaca]